MMNRIITNKRFWIPIIISIPVCVACFVITAMTSDFGFETYWAAAIFFPYAMLSTLIFGVIPVPIAIASFFQIPIYGVVIGWSLKRKRMWAVWAILLLHIIAAGLAVKFIIYRAPAHEYIFFRKEGTRT